MKKLTLTSLLGVVLAVSAVAASRAPSPFAAGSRVVFYGDSITTHNYFTYQIEFI